MKKKRILVCPLDWGIGHASRDVIIIRKFLEQGNEVVLGGGGSSLKFLSSEFPHLEVIKIPSHKFFYSTIFPAWFMILIQVPAFLKGILVEHRSLKKIIDSYHIDGIISDARYGLWNHMIPSVIITHQVRIRMPLLFRPIEFLINYINRLALEKFSCHWIPDWQEDQNLSGKLSHKIRMPANSSYIGCLSRFTGYLQQTEITECFDVVILLSGPEPQRSVFEKIVTGQLVEQNRRSLIIGGLIEESPEGKQYISSLNKRIPFITGTELHGILISAKYIICRSGYSTIMDLVTIGKTAFLVPTPGQTEQEYLAMYLQDQGLFRYSKQGNFNLEDAIKKLDVSAVPDFRFAKNNLLDGALDLFFSGKKIS